MVGDLKPIREDLTLHPGPRRTDGAPSWTIHDPVANRFFRMSWENFEILSRWSQKNPEDIAASIRRETTLDISIATIKGLERHLLSNHLLQPVDENDRQRFLQVVRSQKKWGWSFIFSKYLFFKVPLVHPDDWLKQMVSKISWIFTRFTFFMIILTACVGMVWTLQQWESFGSSFMGFFSPSGLLHYGVAMVVAKSAHELGHALAARYFGCRVSTMGIAFIVFWPVLYTETNDLWKIPEKKARMIVAASGLLVELGLAGLASFAWHFLPEGGLKEAAFLLASTTWILTLVVNINPFTRFDAYFLLSDALNLPNLYARSFAFGRWWVREIAFGLNQPPPELLPAGTRRFLVFFAVVTWIYRVVLFSGIALLVYHMFFKLLGLILFLVEIFWFILNPIFTEVKTWFSLPQIKTTNGHALATGLLFIVLVSTLFIPWSSTLQVPAFVRAKRHAVVHAPEVAKIQTFPITMGQRVRAGDTLFQLYSPDLVNAAQTIQRAIGQITWQLNAPGAKKPFLEIEQSLQSQLKARQAEYHAIAEKIDKLNAKAPFQGEVVGLQEHLAVGDWISENEPLVTLVDRSQAIIEAIVPADAHLPLAGDEGVFRPELSDWPPINCHLGTLDRVTMTSLPQPLLATVYGGSVDVHVMVEGVLRPRQGHFLATCVPVKDGDRVKQVIRGTLSFREPGEAPVIRLVRWIHSILLRESGF